MKITAEFETLEELRIFAEDFARKEGKDGGSYKVDIEQPQHVKVSAAVKQQTTKPAAQKQPEPEVAPAPEPPVVKQYKFEELRKAAIAWVQSGAAPDGLNKIKEVVSSLGVKQMTDISEEQLPAFAQKLQALGAAV